MHMSKDKSAHFINNQQEDWNYKFDHVLDNASQETVYDTCARSETLEAFRSFLTSYTHRDIDNVGGYNGTVLAYGQTGAGKTFTMVPLLHSLLACGFFMCTCAVFICEDWWHEGL